MTGTLAPAPATLLLGGADVLTFANDWAADPTSKHHIMRRLSRYHDVLWVESAGMRTPSLSSAYDRSRLLRKAKSMLRDARQELGRLYAFTPPSLPFPGSRAAQAINGVLYRQTISRQLRRLGFDDRPLVWSFLPQLAGHIRRMPRRFTIYHCVDRWSAFKDFDPAVMERGEADLCSISDLVLASAQDLAERCRRYSDNVHYVPHGVDFEHFRSALDEGPLPADLASIPEPRVGFFGLIHEWVDTELIAELADALPYSFVVIGSAKGDISHLTSRKNVYYLGRKPYAELPAYSRGFQAAIVPFKITELTVSVNPIKLREYAAAGLPVVSTDLPEVRKCGEIATCVGSRDEWVEALREAVERGSDRDARVAQSELVRDEDWSAVCDRIATLVNAIGDRGGAS
jgi:glycosyltransferase involved in cell wall biosynthesis